MYVYIYTYNIHIHIYIYLFIIYLYTCLDQIPVEIFVTEYLKAGTEWFLDIVIQQSVAPQMYPWMSFDDFGMPNLSAEVLHDGAANRWIKHGPHDFEFELPRHEDGSWKFMDHR